MQREKASSKRRSGPARIREIDIDVDTLNDPLVVSEVAQVPGRTDRLRLSVNQVELGDVTLDYVVDERLREGRTLTRAEALHVLGALQRTIVLDKALDLLAVRARSTRDLGIRLRRAGARDGDIAWVQDRLTAQGFLDDASFARCAAEEGHQCRSRDSGDRRDLRRRRAGRIRRGTGGRREAVTRTRVARSGEAPAAAVRVSCPARLRRRYDTPGLERNSLTA
jgi:hypothetical protein